MDLMERRTKGDGPRQERSGIGRKKKSQEKADSPEVANWRDGRAVNP